MNLKFIAQNIYQNKESEGFICQTEIWQTRNGRKKQDQLYPVPKKYLTEETLN
jgi:hypothetical protein